MAPRFSVVLPVHNRADRVGRAAVAVLGQTFGDFELVVADADSEDTTLEAVRTVADNRVRIVHGPTVQTARAAAIRASGGTWVAVIDPDTVPRPNWLARIGRLADASGADVVWCGGTQHHWDHSRTEVLPSADYTRPGAVIAKRVRPDDPHIVSTPELLLDWHDATASVPESPDERRFLWATDAIATLGVSPIPAPELLARYATVAGVSAARLHRRTEARRLLNMARKIQLAEPRSWARWAAVSVPGLSDWVWPEPESPGRGVGPDPSAGPAGSVQLARG